MLHAAVKSATVEIATTRSSSRARGAADARVEETRVARGGSRLRNKLRNSLIAAGLNGRSS